jgi:activator of HSP90 ATPase
MMYDKSNSAFLSNRPTRRQAIVGVAMAFGGLSLASTEAGAQGKEELSHTAESIHQEVVFKASRKRVYQALMDSKQFEQIVQLSDARKTMLKPGAPHAKISPEVGGPFSIFGGLIVGRQIELVPDTRIAQVWRPAYWEPGVYSLVKFDLSDSGAGTKLVLDHRGFPDGDGKSLLEGWSKNYWQPMAKFLA